MQLYTPEEYILDVTVYSPQNILLKGIALQLDYYRQGGGLPATILLDIKDNSRALAIAYFMFCVGRNRPKRNPAEIEHSSGRVWEIKNSKPIPAGEFIQFALNDVFMPVVNMIRKTFKNSGVGMDAKVVEEYYQYFSEVAVPTLMCGDYDNSQKWSPKFYTSVD